MQNKNVKVLLYIAVALLLLNLGRDLFFGDNHLKHASGKIEQVQDSLDKVMQRIENAQLRVDTLLQDIDGREKEIVKLQQQVDSLNQTYGVFMKESSAQINGLKIKLRKEQDRLKELKNEIK